MHGNMLQLLLTASQEQDHQQFSVLLLIIEVLRKAEVNAESAFAPEEPPAMPCSEQGYHLPTGSNCALRCKHKPSIEAHYLKHAQKR
jgi:nitrate reductase cytochrome c-type subunit